MSIRNSQPPGSWETGLRLHEGDDWKVPADTDPDGRYRTFEHRAPAYAVAMATLRRVGWLDQKGRVWLEMPSAATFDGGSLTPLLIDPREGS